jgi:AcrR family transcriptional regulator
LDAALEIIREGGPDQLSMRSLAERIDYSPAGLYEYFSSKEEIVLAVCMEGQDALYASMEEVDPNLPAGDYLYLIGKAYIRFALKQPDYFLLMFTTAPPANMAEAPAEALHDLLHREGSAYGVLLRAIQRGLDEGIFHVRPGFGLNEMVYAAWSLVHGIAMLRVTALRPYPADLEAMDDQALANFMRGLQAA